MENIDIKIVFRRLLRNWYWFVLSAIVCLGVGMYYLATTSSEYALTSTIQLKDQGLADKGSPQEKFLNGFELLSTTTQLEDEIGVLTSYSTIKQSLENLNHEIDYYQYPKILGETGKKFAKPLYPAPFKVLLDTAGWHLMYADINITFLEGQMYHVKIETKEGQPVYYYNTVSKKVVQKDYAVVLDTILSVKNPLKTPYLQMRLTEVDQNAIQANNKSYFIKIKSLDDATQKWRKLLVNEPITEKSNIIRLSLKTDVPNKGIEFLNSLNDVYIQNDLRKKNLLGQKTIEFIDFQLQGVSDSLRKAEADRQGFRNKDQIIDIGSASQNLVQQQNMLDDKQAQLNVQNKYYQYIADYMAKNEDISDIVAPSSVGIQDPLLNNLLLELTTLNAEKISKDYNCRRSYNHY